MSSFDSYNQRLGLGPNAHDDLKSCNGSVPQRSATASHDPYRFTRSTQQPIKANAGGPGIIETPAKPVKPPDYPKYRFVFKLILFSIFNY